MEQNRLFIQDFSAPLENRLYANGQAGISARGNQMTIDFWGNDNLLEYCDIGFSTWIAATWGPYLPTEGNLTPLEKTISQAGAVGWRLP